MGREKKKKKRGKSAVVLGKFQDHRSPVFGTNHLELEWFAPQKGTAVLNGLSEICCKERSIFFPRMGYGLPLWYRKTTRRFSEISINSRERAFRKAKMPEYILNSTPRVVETTSSAENRSRTPDGAQCSVFTFFYSATSLLIFSLFYGGPRTW